MSINDATVAAWDAARQRPAGTDLIDPDGEFAGKASAEYVPDFTHLKTPDEAPAADGSGNPKARVGSLKAPLHLVPPALSIGVAYALKDGAAKYGAYNWREEPINVSTYIGAILRHLYAYQDGENYADDSGVSHLAHVAACCALLMDSEAWGSLVDDRSYGPAAEILEEYINEAS